MLIRVVDLSHFLICVYQMVAEVELQTAVRQLTVHIVEEFVDEASIDHTVERDLTLDIPIIGVKQNLDIRVVRHALEHLCVAVLRYRLIPILKVAIIPAYMNGHPPGHARTEFLRGQAPLLQIVAIEYLLVDVFCQEVQLATGFSAELEDR